LISDAGRYILDLLERSPAKIVAGVCLVAPRQPHSSFTQSADEPPQTTKRKEPP